MRKCFVFDESTAAAVRSAGSHAEEVANADVPTVIAEVVQQQRTVVLVVPAGADRATVARITPPEPGVRSDEA